MAVGGDGSASEVFGGMLSREDGLKVPVGYIPNGSFGKLAFESGVYDINMALDTIIAATVTKMSAIECLSDIESATKATYGLIGFFKRRFCFVSTNFNNMDNLTNPAAVAWKPRCGFRAYFLAFLKYMSCSTPKWRNKFMVTIDGKSYSNEGNLIMTDRL